MTTFIQKKNSLLNTALSILMLSSVHSAFAADYNTGSVSLSIDNDSIADTDQEYSSGVYFKFFSDASDDIKYLGPKPVQLIADLLPLQSQTHKTWGVTLGQQLWTPTDIALQGEVINERPYAGYLFSQFNINEFSSQQANKFSFSLGMIGPDSLGEQSQKSIHSMIAAQSPMGWNEQVKRKTLVGIGYETQHAMMRDKVSENHETDLGLSGRATLSNYQSEVAVGGTIRFGKNLTESFGSTGLTKGNYVDASVLSLSKDGYFMYLSSEARYRFNDYTIEGARPKHLYDINIEHIQATVSAGVVMYREAWGASFSLVTNTRSFEEANDSYHTIGSLDLFWRF